MSDSPEGRASDHPGVELVLFAADEATPAQRAVIREHLGRCAECRASLRELRDTWQELDAQPMADLPERQWQRTLRAAMSPRLTPSIERRRWSISGPAVAGLAAAVVLVAAVLALAAAGARQAREVERLRADLRDTRALAVVAMLREPASAERLRGVALGGPLLGQDPRIAAAFVTALQSDPSPNVRLAVLDAVDGAPRHAQLATEILNALPTEPQPVVRLAMIELVAELGDPRSREALDAMASGDPDPTVRARARSASDRLSVRPPGVTQ